jgi:CheY-like chemotaxis protein
MKRRILIVEDESIVADDLAWKVMQLGYEVVAISASGEEAVRTAAQQMPHLVLMDVQLQGGMPGTEAARLIQEQTGAAIVFVTAFAGVFLRDPALMQAPGICLSKPFSVLQLKTALQAASAAHS